MKRTCALLGIFTLCLAFAAGGSAGEVIRVGSMPNGLGLPVVRAERAGYFKEAGLDVEIVVFATGAPINEAMAAEAIDIACSGLASVYALATGQYKYVADGVIAAAGDGIYARPDSPFAKAKTGNLRGDAASVKGAELLSPLATIGHYTAIKYAEALGLAAGDINIVSMDYPQAFQAFLVGQGDLVASTMPYSAKLEEEGCVLVADLKDVTGKGWMDTVFAQNSMVENRRDEVVAFLDCYYRACADLQKDEAMRRELGMEWYASEGRNYTKFDMDTEVEQKVYPVLAELPTEEGVFGATMLGMGEFFTGQGMIDPADLQNVAASMDSSMVRELQAKAGK